MAQPPEQITDTSIRQAITDRLQATHVEVTDMSGTGPFPPIPSLSLLTAAQNHENITPH